MVDLKKTDTGLSILGEYGLAINLKCEHQDVNECPDKGRLVIMLEKENEGLVNFYISDNTQTGVRAYVSQKIESIPSVISQLQDLYIRSPKCLGKENITIYKESNFILNKSKRLEKIDHYSISYGDNITSKETLTEVIEFIKPKINKNTFLKTTQKSSDYSLGTNHEVVTFPLTKEEMVILRKEVLVLEV